MRTNSMKTTNNNKGLTIIELLITISVGSMVIIMLMNILSSTLLTRNIVEHENRLKSEAYMISEFLQETIFDLGVRSLVEEIGDDHEQGDTHQVLILRQEYEIRKSRNSGVIYRDYSQRNAFVLHHDKNEEALYYGPLEAFNLEGDDIGFTNRANYRINSPNVAVEALNLTEGTQDTSIDHLCLLEGEFRREESDDEDEDETRNVTRCASAIIELNLQLSFRIEDNPVFKPQSFYSTIVF